MSPIGGLDRPMFICMSAWVSIQMAYAWLYSVRVSEIVPIGWVACCCVSGRGCAEPHVDRVLVDVKPIHSCLISHLG
ncbi:hypothetical protein EDB19DRAFT_1741944 [Suillus lakei]|nr:hypothetical protein EDB19DRAFT_1741944 [Suillus lakei]